MSLSGFAGGASDALERLLAEEFLKTVQRKKLAQDDRSLDLQQGRDTVNAEIGRGNLGVSQRNAAVNEGNLGLRGKEFEQGVREYDEGAPIRAANLEYTGAQIGELKRKPLAEQQGREHDLKMSGVMHGNRLGEIRAQGDQSARVASIRQPTGLRPAQAMTQTRLLQNDYRKVMGSAREMQRQLGIMESGLDAARKGDLNAGSQAVLITFQKILDPTSVVRESEYSRTPEGMGLLQRIEGMLPRLTQGGPGVPPEQLETFAALARQLTQGVMQDAQSHSQNILDLAKEYGIDPSLVSGSNGTQTPQGNTAGGMEFDWVPGKGLVPRSK